MDGSGGDYRSGGQDYQKVKNAFFQPSVFIQDIKNY